MYVEDHQLYVYTGTWCILPFLQLNRRNTWVWLYYDVPTCALSVTLGSVIILEKNSLITVWTYNCNHIREKISLLTEWTYLQSQTKRYNSNWEFNSYSYECINKHLTWKQNNFLQNITI
jgi:hypothetical protein